MILSKTLETAASQSSFITMSIVGYISCFLIGLMITLLLAIIFVDTMRPKPEEKEKEKEHHPFSD